MKRKMQEYDELKNELDNNVLKINKDKLIENLKKT